MNQQRETQPEPQLALKWAGDRTEEPPSLLSLAKFNRKPESKETEALEHTEFGLGTSGKGREEQKDQWRAGSVSRHHTASQKASPQSLISVHQWGN